MLLICTDSSHSHYISRSFALLLSGTRTGASSCFQRCFVVQILWSRYGLSGQHPFSHIHHPKGSLHHPCNSLLSSHWHWGWISSAPVSRISSTFYFSVIYPCKALIVVKIASAHHLLSRFSVAASRSRLTHALALILESGGYPCLTTRI